MSINELKIYLDLSLDSKSKVLDKYAKVFNLSNYFFVDSEDGQCYLFDEDGNEKDISLVHKITESMIPKNIEKIVIPNSIMSIEDSAFYNCNRLTSLTIPDSVTSIGYGTFAWCSELTSITIPNSVWIIGSRAFYGCRLIDVVILGSVTNIGYDAFYSYKNIKSLVFKNKTMKQIKSMENYPFGIKDESVIKAELS